MKFLHSYLAFNVLLETVFERAEDYFIRAKIDPRLIVRLFPKYRGKLIGTAEEVEVFDGLRSTLEKMDPIEDISASIYFDVKCTLLTCSRRLLVAKR